MALAMGHDMCAAASCSGPDPAARSRCCRLTRANSNSQAPRGSGCQLGADPVCTESLLVVILLERESCGAEHDTATRAVGSVLSIRASALSCICISYKATALLFISSHQLTGQKVVRQPPDVNTASRYMLAKAGPSAKNETNRLPSFSPR